MAEQGIHKINNLRRRYVGYWLLADALWAVALSLVAYGLLLYFSSATVFWSGVIFIAVAIVLIAVHRPWQVSKENIAGFLDRQYPELEESTGLILQPAGSLNVLQQLAVNKTNNVLQSLKVGHGHFAKRLLWPFIALTLVVIFVVVLSRIPNTGARTIWTKSTVPGVKAAPPEKTLPQIDGVTLTIIPPAYTRKASRVQDRFNLAAEEGSIVQWGIKTNVAVKKAYLIFNDNEQVALKGGNGNTEWSAAKAINKAGFYQVSIDGKLSDFYQLQVVKDHPPVIHVKAPKQYTYIDAGESQKVNILTTLNDDYDIADATIVATVAKGRGEGVKFEEYKLNFATSFGGRQARYDLQKLVDLPTLNMEPGDELYFYVQAQDNHRQQSRTDVFTVTIQDTAELLSMDGILAGANVKPEFFRSERQIIIDAEQLIKDKDSISVEKFKNRSNDLGIDQKLLRLRYGKFLGEEDEQDISGGKDEPSDPADFSNATKLLKEYTDDHDNAADPQFFEPAIKAQLKATLSEMWKCELQLRLYKPQAALPFAYKALRLLKDLQQKSRSYVAKTSYNPPPLKLDKRLSGELDKIIQPTNRQDMKAPADQQIALKNAVPVLEELKIKLALTANNKYTLQQANQQLSLKASAQPGTYLPALSAMRRVLSAQTISLSDVNTVERAIQKALIPVKVIPKSESVHSDMGLSKSYFKNLKQANR
jgi:hypothetical protein